MMLARYAPFPHQWPAYLVFIHHLPSSLHRIVFLSPLSATLVPKSSGKSHMGRLTRQW
jgi:hypothetical protein